MASHEWIDQHVYADQRHGGSLFQFSWTPTQEAPHAARSRIGDCEIDSMHASRGKAVVVTMAERRSRRHLLAYAPDRTAETVMPAIVVRLGRVRRGVHTPTADSS